jgi:hypothetical protein
VVAVDLTLLHKHGIPLQEVPLLCCRPLDSDAQDEPFSSLTLTEGDMLLHAAHREREQAEAKMKRKPPGSGVAIGTELSPPFLVSESVDQKKHYIGLGSSSR